MTAADVKAALRAVADPAKAAFFPRFFKTGPGEYGEGDQFLGVTVPKQRLVAKRFRGLPLPEVKRLLTSKIHEERLTALLLLVYRYENGTEATRREIYDFYLAHTELVNNWDLVDSSAEYIVGPWLEQRDRKVLDKLAASKLIWERRIAIISTLHFIRAGEYDTTLRIAAQLMNDRHDLIHKAVGWMLREVGKRDERRLKDFLAEHYRTMPRTMLRYAIERFGAAERGRYLRGEV